jgi:hypothetical protein
MREGYAENTPRLSRNLDFRPAQLQGGKYSMRVSSLTWVKESTRPVHLSIWHTARDESGELHSVGSFDTNLTLEEAESLLGDLQGTIAELKQKVPATN